MRRMVPVESFGITTHGFEWREPPNSISTPTSPLSASSTLAQQILSVSRTCTSFPASCAPLVAPSRPTPLFD